MKLLNPYLDLVEAIQSLPSDPQLAIRKKLIWAYSWAIPNEEAVDTLRSLSPLIELGAGSGYWAWLLRQAGADVIAFDQNPKAPPHWTSVEEGDEGVIESHPHRTLFLCWPPYRDEMACRALRAYSGSIVAYVGEMNGRTADDEFHELLSREFVLKRQVKIPSWPGYRDLLQIFERS
jgi:hypothetical protein